MGFVQNALIIGMLAVVLFSLAVGYYIAPQAQPQALAKGPQATASPAQQAARQGITVQIPAIDENGEGKVARVNVQEMPGSGRVLIELGPDNPIIGGDTQDSIRTAVELGKMFSTRDTAAIDLRYSISAPSDEVSGKSAGAAVAVATMALLRGERLRPDTIITGTVNSRGVIGPVGGVLQKAKAAGQMGFRRIIVPVGEATAAKSETRCTQTSSPNGVRRECTRTAAQVSVAAETGLEVFEVRDAGEALELWRE